LCVFVELCGGSISSLVFQAADQRARFSVFLSSIMQVEGYCLAKADTPISSSRVSLCSSADKTDGS
jgi:hypothetical protein